MYKNTHLVHYNGDLMKHGYLFIHGVGRTVKSYGYATKFIERILDKDPNAHAHEVSWAHIMQDREEKLVKELFSKPKWYRPLKLLYYQARKFIFTYAADATAYRYKTRYNILQEVIKNIDDLWNKMGQEGQITIIGHSLGATIAYDLLKKYPQENVKNLITVGANLHIFHFDVECLTGLRWSNWYDPDDLLGMPVLCEKVLNTEQTVGIGPTSHSRYLKNKKLFKKIYSWIHE